MVTTIAMKFTNLLMAKLESKMLEKIMKKNYFKILHALLIFLRVVFFRVNLLKHLVKFQHSRGYNPNKKKLKKTTFDFVARKKK